MFDFFDKLENKRAFKKALKEIQQEGNPSRSSASVSRVYSNETSNITGGGAGGSFPRYSDGLLKPDSEVVDMKNFKDWRKVERVESNHPVYKDKLFAGSLKNATDKPVEKAEPVYEKTIDEDEQKSIVDFLHDDEEKQDRKARNDFMSFMLKKSDEKEEQKTVVQKPEENKQPENKPEEKNQFKLLYEEIQRRKAEAAKRSAVIVQPEQNQEVKPAPAPVKVEEVKKVEPEIAKPEIKPVVGEMAEPKKPAKKVVNRKPRGKNKRRFDADVIGSVDWR